MKDDSVESNATGKSFDECYDLDKQLGTGVFSVVKLGRHKETNTARAIKIMAKGDMEEFDKKCVLQEIETLSHLKHPHIVQLIDVFDSADHVHMVLECGESNE